MATVVAWQIATPQTGQALQKSSRKFGRTLYRKNNVLGAALHPIKIHGLVHSQATEPCLHLANYHLARAFWQALCAR